MQRFRAPFSMEIYGEAVGFVADVLEKMEQNRGELFKRKLAQGGYP